MINDNRYVKKPANSLSTLEDTIQMSTSHVRKKWGAMEGPKQWWDMTAAVLNGDFMRQRGQVVLMMAESRRCYRGD